MVVIRACPRTLESRVATSSSASIERMAKVWQVAFKENAEGGIRCVERAGGGGTAQG